ncbi:YD repeat-containing protein [Rhodanobacter sp. ANJX3]|uniref:beta strand repeat-containing protein n=1 Tax=Rhodanobacter sp. ANJX3 TaxID=2723083 RepID=UPI00160F4166|nr:IPT/TIG domain-containing protein [Rhodanobacter sp. ANJX3]MBB5357045.1 YD repeat-containing protein [Rhodanobacter sp. ANJX3]
MESQDERSAVVEDIALMSLPAKRKYPLRGWVSARVVIRLLLWSLFLLCLGVTEAQVTGASPANTYVYDANGRLVAITKSDGTSTPYIYDTLGNLVRIGSVLSAGQLAVFTFSPAHGNVGTPVTIQGQGFSSTLANDSVSFNGSTTSVMSATATQLVTSVPVGASSGPITVTVGGQTATSATSFVVDSTGLPPSIAQVTPLFSAVGGTVTVAGTHLYPVPGNTTMLAGGLGVTLSSATDAQLQFVLPNNAVSGHVVVQTPYGQATSALPIVILPTGLNATNVVSSGNAALNGSPVALSIGASGQTGAVTFDGTAGSWLSLQASAITTTGSINYTIYAPGNVVIQQGNLSSGSPTIHLPQLKGGTYLATFTPNGAGAQLSVGVETNTTLSTGVSATVVTSVQGQSKRVLFQAVANQLLTFEVISTTTTPASHAVTYTVYTPTGASYTSSTTTGGPISLGAMPTTSTGTYQVIIAPGSGVIGTVQVEVVPGAGGVLSSTNTSQNYAATFANQNVYLSFTANQDATLDLTLTGLAITGSSLTSASVDVYDPSGALVTYTTCYTTSPGNSCRLTLWNLAAGTYSVVVSPPSTNSIISFHAALGPDAAGPALTASTATTVTLGSGQTERLTFNANAGDTVALNLANVSTTPAGQTLFVYVYRPDAGVLTAGNYYSYVSTASSGTSLNLPNLPVSGAYTVRIYTDYAEPGSAQVTLIPGVTGTLPINDTSKNYASAVNQNAYLSFTATSGANLELTLTGLTITGTSTGPAAVNVYNAAGSNVASTSCYANNPGGSCRLPLWNLASGTYSVIVSPPGTNSTMAFNALLEADVTGSALIANTPTAISLGAGQVERLTFSANAGDTVALNLSGVGTTPSGQTVYAYVYRPDNGRIVSGSSPYAYVTSSGPSSTVNLPKLPVSGNYTVMVYTTYGNPASAQLTLLSGVAGTLSSNGSSQNYASSAVNQNVYLSFTANQGDTLDLTLAGLAISGSSANSAYVNVTNAAGTNIVSTTCFTSNPGNDCRLTLWNLTAGTYSVVVSPPNASSTISFSTLLEPEVAGPALTVGSPTAVSLGTGQIERLTFSANAGDTVALSLSGVSTTPTGQTIYANVYRPDTGVVTSSNTYATTNSSGSSATLNLPNLPASGTYIVRLYTVYGEPGSAQLTLESDVSAAPPVYGTPTLPDNGVQQSEAGAAAGQNVMMSFNANQGDTLTLTLTGLAITGSTSTSAAVNVYGPSGTNVASTTCYTSNPGNSCRLPLWNLTAGTYSVTVSSPNASSTISFNAMLGPDVVGPALVTNTPTTVTLGAGQTERLTFNATAGSTVALNLSNVSTTPTGQAVFVYVYRPDTGTITATNAYTSTNVSGGSSGTLNLSNLPASGTYTVKVYTSYGEPGSVQLTLVSGVTGALSATSTNYATAVANQTVNLSFAASEGNNLELAVTGLAFTGSGATAVSVNVYNGVGTNVGSTSCYTNNPGDSCRLPLYALAAGTYEVVIAPPGGSGTMSFNAQLSPDVVGTALTASTPATVNLGSGQVERLTFSANAGDTVFLKLSNQSTSPAGQVVEADVFRPDAGAINASTPFYTTLYSNGSDMLLNLPNLPVSGNYLVRIYTVYGEPGSAQLTLAPGMTGTLTTNGGAQSYANALNGQNVYLSFAANPGNNLELTFNNISGSFTSDVYNAAGSSVASASCSASNPGASCTQSLYNLPGGTYSVVLTPGGSTGLIGFQALLQSDTLGPNMTFNAPTSVALGAGQVERLTFNANAGDAVTLNMSGASTTPAGQYLYAYIYRPDVGAITSSSSYYAYFESTGSNNALNLPSLPVSGSYLVRVYTGYGEPASAQLGLLAAATGTLLTTGTSHSYATTTAGQNVTLSFATNQSANLELTLNGLTIAGSSATSVTADVYDVNGNYVASTMCNVDDPGSGCRLPLWNLPGGNDSVVVYSPSAGSTMSFNAILESDATGPALAANTPTTVALGAGQVQRLTFSANAGAAVALNLSGVNLPAGQFVYVDVYRPDTGAITPTNYYASADVSGSGTVLNLSNLPATGVYTLLVYTGYGQPGGAQLTLVPQ